MNIHILLYIALLVTYCHTTKDTFSKINDSLFTNIQCVPYAYGDFNADKRVDIFCVNKQSDQIEIWLAQEKEPLFSICQTLKLDSKIVIIVPGDFTGDSVMDILVTYKTDDNFKMSFYQGHKKSKESNELGNEMKIDLVITDQPFIAE